MSSLTMLDTELILMHYETTEITYPGVNADSTGNP